MLDLFFSLFGALLGAYLFLRHLEIFLPLALLFASFLLVYTYLEGVNASRSFPSAAITHNLR